MKENTKNTEMVQSIEVLENVDTTIEKVVVTPQKNVTSSESKKVDKKTETTKKSKSTKKKGTGTKIKAKAKTSKKKKKVIDLSKLHLTKEVADDYSIKFGEGESEQKSMELFLQKLEEETKWQVLSLKGIIFDSLAGSPMLLESLKKEKHICKFPDDAVLSVCEHGETDDSYTGSNMLITIFQPKENDPEKEPVQLSLLPEDESLKENNVVVEKPKKSKKKTNKKASREILRFLPTDNVIEDLKYLMGASAPCYKKFDNILDKVAFLNLCKKTLDDKRTLALIRFNKLITAHGENTYGILPQDKLFLSIENILDKDFDGAEFLGGSYNHYFTKARWILPNQKNEIMQTYIETCKSMGITSTESFVPSIEFQTSDCGDSAAIVKTSLVKGSMEMYLGNPIRIPHKSGRTVEDYADQMNGLLASMKDLVQSLERLFEIKIKNPLNSFIKLCAKNGLNKSVSLQSAEIYQSLWDGQDEISAHDIYMALQETLYLMVQDENISRNTCESVSENLASLILQTNIWEDSDTTIVPEWIQ